MIKRFFPSTVRQQEESGFNMLDYSPSVWLDAQDSGTIILTSGKVSQWSDKSGNNNHAIQGIESIMPLYGSSSVSNFFNAIEITNTALMGFELTSSLSFSEVIFVTAYKTGTESIFTGFPYFFCHIDSEFTTRLMGSNNNNFLHSSDVITNQVYKNGAETSTNVILPLPLSVCNFRFSSVTKRLDLLRSRYRVDRILVGFTGEIIMFQNQLSSQDRSDIVNHLMQKWGIL